MSSVLKNKKFFPDKLKVGDVVEVTTILGGTRNYEVLSVDGNKAYTKFRTFNTAVRYDGRVFEFGKSYRNDLTSNDYFKKQNEPKKDNQ